jgi:hypothetical protein
MKNQKLGLMLGILDFMYFRKQFDVIDPKIAESLLENQFNYFEKNIDFENMKQEDYDSACGCLVFIFYF